MTKAGYHTAARRLWRRAYGPIPRGHDIHHKNGDYRVNELSNLECVPQDEHQRRHVAAWVAARPTKVCAHCGREFRDPTAAGKVGKKRFCSANCLCAARKQSGVDDESRVCPRCGTSFRKHKYSTTRHCSRTCAMHSLWVRRHAKRALAVLDSSPTHAA